MSRQSRHILLVLIIAWLGLVALPWYGVAAGFWSFAWLAAPTESANASGMVQMIAHGRHWLWPVPVLLALALTEVFRSSGPRSWVITWCGGLALAYLLLQGFALGLKGWNFSSLETLFGPASPQIGMGSGAFVVGTACLLLLSAGLALKGYMRGDVFLVSSIAVVVACIGLFVFFPVALILVEAALTPEGGYSLVALAERLFSADVWSVTWNSLILAVAVGLATTLLGLGFALLHKRTGFRAKGLLRLLAILPIITPPFVIGLGIILLFGRNGMATWLLNEFLGIPPSRWIYGFFGLLLVQTLAFTPIAYLVLIGVVDGISPSMEEAAQTLRANRWRTFKTVTWPLMRPGLANAFLIGFVESLADFGNPLVLGGNYDVLSTDIFFAIVGSQNDPGRASALSIALLFLTLSAFVLQRQWIGKKVYTTISGKGDSGLPAPLPVGVKRLVYWATMPWLAFTILLYGIILIGGFVKSLGIDNTPTLQHYVTAFGIDWTEHGLLWSGRAWPSFFTTVELAAIAAPLTAVIGLLTAYLLNRQRFIGQSAFEFITMLSFAIPGTVIGVSYILAFNVPPIELTGTGLILIICFVFRNMPVSIRAGLATMAQIDKSLDECSLMLRHGSFATIRRVVLPLLRPAIVASLVYAFVRAITSVSAVIFLVSAQYNLATAYIVGRVEVSDFGVAIAYSSVLILFMLLAIGLIQLGVGEQRRAARRTAPAALGIGRGTT
ncbi:ABC transporter permease [Taklimakanibacter lacteus]|uniref:ABC transporter permease n=1 Tax=Taklimakanibacter lacteus TaxID=2268456 RepID=UPI000E666953